MKRTAALNPFCVMVLIQFCDLLILLPSVQGGIAAVLLALV